MPTIGGQREPVEVGHSDAAGFAGDEDVGDRPDGEEEGVREGQLAGGPDEQVQADGAHDRPKTANPVRSQNSST